uniref:Uncharacterized protein n=1 Tax=Cannabis sativa TaxID=3483 RepID=A0A803R425_CANSA
MCTRSPTPLRRQLKTIGHSAGPTSFFAFCIRSTSSIDVIMETTFSLNRALPRSVGTRLLVFRTRLSHCSRKTNFKVIGKGRKSEKYSLLVKMDLEYFKGLSREEG